MTTDVDSTEERVPSTLPVRQVVRTWWPLAASWLLMAAEGPAMSAAVARLADPEIHLAAWGGIVWPLSMLIGSPIVMLLSASTALSKDWDSYVRVRRFMMRTSAILTALHALIAFTPAYYVVAVHLIGAPAEIIEPARVGLMIMMPWTWSIAYRRFNQGVLIRFGHSRAVGLGTMIRLGTDVTVLAAGYLIGTIPGIVVATSAIAAGVLSEAIYAGLRVRPVLRRQLKLAESAAQPLTLRVFLQFYAPLATTSLMNMLAQPLSSAAISRMPGALDSLATWSVVSSFIFLPRSLGYAFNEVVIALLDEPRATRTLRRFAMVLVALTSLALLVVAATPLGAFWFARVSALKPRLAALASRGLWAALPLPALSVLQSWYQGTIVHSQRTRGIPEAVAAFLLVGGAVMSGGVIWGQVTGLYVGLVGLTVGVLAQTVWLWYRSRPAMRVTQARDEVLSTV